MESSAAAKLQSTRETHFWPSEINTPPINSTLYAWEKRGRFQCTLESVHTPPRSTRTFYASSGGGNSISIVFSRADLVWVYYWAGGQQEVAERMSLKQIQLEFEADSTKDEDDLL